MTGKPASCSPQFDSVDRERLAADLRSLGVKAGQDLLIHCSLRSVGLIDGGPAALLDAITDVAGPRATLVAPTHTTMNSLTSRAFRAATAGLSKEEHNRFVAAMPGFDPASTPSTGMGALAEYLRTRPAACRSSHPQVSFAAVGARARECTLVHDLDCHLGERSPLGWLYRADAAILLLGVGYSVCTAFHLAEYRIHSSRPSRLYQCFALEGGTRVMREFTDIKFDDSDFSLLGADLESAAGSGVRLGKVGSAECRLIPIGPAVDFACSWLRQHRIQGVS